MDIFDYFVHLTRLSLQGSKQDIVRLVRKNIKQFSKEYPEFAKELSKELLNVGDNVNLTRKAVPPNPLPIDVDSKLELVKKEEIKFEEIVSWQKIVSDELELIIKERKFCNELRKTGLSPTRSALFVGPPGVGKTLAAKWISAQLNKPLVTLDLAAVMSSYLGRTGNNIRAVLEFAKKNDCILLLDEFDAIAKKRGDDSELGELKRLVTVLLQEIDEWPDSNLLIAATNHEELLDPAVWRRFDRVVQFPKPSFKDLQITIKRLLLDEFPEKDIFIDTLAILLEGASYSEVTKKINNIRKESILSETNIRESIEDYISKMCDNMDKSVKIQTALKFIQQGYSQRKTAEILGISRDTIRKYQNTGN
ncbi:AAA family ATPase [Lysinibacillus fusiformis]|uniref:AAA family ATPase n=1 Tax=Lysinibacillus fusiformis TaxID=28031 RepID=UPI0015E1255A|nr:AAA family ATPase [Lysinibacillus fusiformis]